LWRGEHRNGATGTKPIPTLAPVADRARHSFALTSIFKLAQHTRYLCGVSAGASNQILRARRHSEYQVVALRTLCSSCSGTIAHR